MERSVACALAIAAGLSGCASVPAGPSVLALPGRGSGFAEFQRDDDACRGFAAERTGASPADAAVRAGVGIAAVATAVGAAAGAAFGSIYGGAADGAAGGAASGLLFGASYGAAHAYEVRGALQLRYDNAYVQCMYASGHRVPLPAGLAQSAPRTGRRLPPPPPGTPPPPPPDV